MCFPGRRTLPSSQFIKGCFVGFQDMVFGSPIVLLGILLESKGQGAKEGGFVLCVSQIMF
jgi:hypothetical protein